MSKDDACKVMSASKHKERKPKKPHYIPRPWGKPYNYKCFQCPFTCMEKSHLYNHMKYSLCKNSLSLLIESDWPYKKGNILHPEQLRPFQQGHGHHATGKDGLEKVTGIEEGQTQQRAVEEEGEDRESQGPEDEEEGGRGEGLQVTSSSIPCYPPPPNLVDYQDPTGLNLSVLGVGYPISPSLFSYMNSLAQLPFLASAAQLMHPASSTHADRALIPPRLYYPFLCEHTFGPASSQSDASKTLKTSTSSLEANPLLQDAPLQTRPTELWYNDHLTSPNKTTSSLSSCGGTNSQDPTAARTMGEGASESVAALLSDLSKALQEYQEAERKISHLEKEDLPAQRHLWEHLSKIRSELSHIHQALERTARQSDGPLDLSVKRDLTDLVGDHGMREDGSLKDNRTETEEEDEELDEKKEEEENESERKAMKASGVTCASARGSRSPPAKVRVPRGLAPRRLNGGLPVAPRTGIECWVAPRLLAPSPPSH
uniref:Proline rich 35 n=1 Tax=Sander lucioperca TaxID=283035 RepID=A0A8D0AAQ0_SANLU